MYTRSEGCTGEGWTCWTGPIRESTRLQLLRELEQNRVLYWEHIWAVPELGFSGCCGARGTLIAAAVFKDSVFFLALFSYGTVKVSQDSRCYRHTRTGPPESDRRQSVETPWKRVAVIGNAIPQARPALCPS